MVPAMVALTHPDAQLTGGPFETGHLTSMKSEARSSIQIMSVLRKEHAGNTWNLKFTSASLAECS